MPKPLAPMKKTKNVMIRMPVELYAQAVEKAKELDYPFLSQFLIYSLKLGLKKKKTASK